MGIQVDFSNIYRSFDNSMQALYALNKVIQDSIGDNEWEILRRFYEEMFSLSDGGVDPIEIQMLLERIMKIDEEDETLDVKKVWDSISDLDIDTVYTFENGKAVPAKDYVDGLKEWAAEHPKDANRFLQIYLRAQRQSPIKSELSRHGILLSAVSQFEFLLVHLLRGYFFHSENDSQLNDDLSLEELDEYISTKIGKKLRHLSPFEKIEFLIQKYPLGDAFSKEKIIEIIERRNIFAHRSGRADKRYAEINNNVLIGDRLRISQNYLRDTLEYLHLWCLIICQKVWRGSNTEEPKGAGKSISDTLMHLMREKRYGYCAKFCEQVRSNVYFNSQNSRDILLVNYAICLDKLGDEKGKMKVLSRVRQTPRQAVHGLEKISSQEPFLYTMPMAVNVLKGNKQVALDLLERAIEAAQVTYLDIDYWVIFDYLQDDPRFQDIKRNLESKILI